MGYDSESSSVEDQDTVGLISNIMEARSEHQMVKRFNFLCNLASVLGLVEIVLVLFWILHYQGGFQWTDPAIQFNWHPALMIIGFVYIHSQSILIYRRARFMNKKTLKITHAAFHGVTLILIVIALVAVFDSHNYAKPKPKPNLYTMHSWIGLLAVILYASQFLISFVTFLFPGLSQSLRSLILPIHTKLGSAIFLLTIVASIMGLEEKALWSMPNYDALPGQAVLMNAIAVLLASFGALVLYLVNDETYKRVATVEDEMVLTDQ